MFVKKNKFMELERDYRGVCKENTRVKASCDALEKALIIKTEENQELMSKIDELRKLKRHSKQIEHIAMAVNDLETKGAGCLMLARVDPETILVQDPSQEAGAGR